MRLEVDKLEDITKIFSHLRRRKGNPGNWHGSTFEGVSHKQVKKHTEISAVQTGGKGGKAD